MDRSTPAVFEMDVARGMDIAFLCHPYHRGGVTRWMADAAAEWRRQGGRSWFAVPTADVSVAGRDRPQLVDLLATQPAELRPMIVGPKVGATFAYGTARYRTSVYVNAVLDGVPPDVPLVVSDDPDVWRAASHLADRNPFVGVLHGDEAKYYDLAVQYRSVLSALVCVSRRITERACAALGPAALRPATIPCGVSLLPLADRSDEGSHVPSHRLELLWVGRMEETAKRVSDLPKIAAALRDARCAFHLHIVGDGPERMLVERAVETHGLGDAVSLHGWRDTPYVSRMLRQSDVLLLPSNFEGMSIAAMEALGAGCAVVASRVSGLEDYDSLPIASGVLSLFPVGDIEAAARAVIAVQRIARADRVRRSRVLAEAEFSIGRSVERYRALVAAITPKSGNSARGNRAPRWIAMEHMRARAIATVRYARLRLRRRLGAPGPAR